MLFRCLGNVLDRAEDPVWIEDGCQGDGSPGLALRIGNPSEQRSRYAILSFTEARRLALRLLAAAEEREAWLYGDGDDDDDDDFSDLV